MPSLSPPMLHHTADRLRSGLRACRGMGALVAISLCFSTVPALFQRFEPGDAVGLFAPWALLLVPRFPWTATAALVPSVVCSIGITGTPGGGTVIAAWFALFVLLRAHRQPQALAIAAATVAGDFLAWRLGHDMVPFLLGQVVRSGICFCVAVVVRRADASVVKAEKAKARALRNQRALIARELHDTLARANTHIVLLAQHAQTDPHNHTAALNDIITTAHQWNLHTTLPLTPKDTP